jgi:hypothetical protein
MFNRINKLALFVILIGLSNANASPKPDATSLLARLPARVNQDVVILDGFVHNAKEVVRWDVIVNDATAVTVEPQNASDVVPIRVAINLRAGNNLVEIKAVSTNKGSEKWTTSILRTSAGEGQRYAFLLGGEGSDPNKVQALNSMLSALKKSGIPTGNMWAGTRYNEFKQRLSIVAKGATSKDRILVYYLGDSKLFGSTGEPMLRVASDSPFGNDGILLSDLVREVQGFDVPALSLLVDTTAEDSETSNATPLRNAVRGSAFASSERMSAPWLRTLVIQHNVEIAMSNVLKEPPSSASGDFTRSFVSALNSIAIDPGRCKTIDDVVAFLNRSTISAQSGSPFPPLYFAENSTSPSFCVSRRDEQASSLVVKASGIPSQMHPHYAGLVSAEIPEHLAAKWAEILVDEVLLRHLPIGRDAIHRSGFTDERIPVSPGQHLIEVRAGVSTDVVASGTTELSVPTENVFAASVSGALHAIVLEPDEPNSVTTDAVVNLDFVVEDKEKGAVRFEVRDNGVVVGRGQSLGRHPGQKLEVFRRIPLSAGVNNIVVEVSRGGLYNQARTSILRRASQSLRAVIIGPDTYQNVPPRPSARADAELIQNLLLHYTEIAPEQITLLTGADASRASIITSIANSKSTKLPDPFPYGNTGEDTLFLYFGGLGATVPGRNGAERFILPYDADPSRLAETCISTTEIDQLLDSWNRSIVVFDTSYDGLAGPQPSAENHDLTSRTFTSYFAKDSTWRLSAGIDRNNRVFIVGNAANTPSLEDNVTQHGLFTSALVDSVQKQLDQPASSGFSRFREMSLVEAYLSARNKTADVTGKREVPLMKGFLVHPFSFSPISASDLRQRVDATLIRTQRDVESLRMPDDLQLQHASELVSKLLAIDPRDMGAQYSFAEIQLLQGDINSAEQLVAKAVSESRVNAGSGSSFLSLWLTLRAQIKMRNADLDGAIADCEEAERSSPTSLKSAYLLGELYAATLQYDKSLQVLSRLVDRFGTTAGKDNLSDEEWGRAILWTYIGLRRLDASANPKAKLRKYAASNPKSGLLFNVLLENRLAKAIFRHSDRPEETLNLDLEEAWTHLVADYLLDPKHFADELRTFRDKNLIFDSKDPRSFNCMLHFYLGMNALFDGSHDLAQQEFSLVVNTAQMQYPEYWTAKRELSKMR